LRRKAVEEKQRLAGVTAATSGQWSAIGPQPIQPCDGATCSGRVWGIGVDPRNSNVVYIGTDGGGVWGTTDRGINWAPLTDSQANINIRDLTLAPSAPDTIFAATYGGGLLKSINDGATWTTLLPSSGGYVYSVAVHPTNASIVLASGCAQVSRSADGGLTWSTTLGVAEGCSDLQQVVFDPINGSIAYAALGDGLHRSTDGGLTWNLVGGAGLPAGPFSWVTVAIAPSSTNILYLALKGGNSLLIGFYRSTDSGATWTQVGAPIGDADYWGWSLRVNPTNPNLIYAGCVLLSTSADGGNTWVENDNGLHVDHHVQTYSGDGSTLYSGNDGGIWSTTAPTSTSTSWTSLNNTLNTALFYPGISISPYTLNITFGGTQDNGTLQYQGSQVWSEAPPCGDGGFTAIDFMQPQNVYAACQSGSTNVVNASNDGGSTWHAAQSGINLQDNSDFIPPLVMDPSSSSRLYFGTSRLYQTVDGANSWTPISADLPDHTVINTIAVAPSDPNTIYTGSWSSIFVTRNALSGSNASWTQLTLTLPLGDVTQIAVDPQQPLTAWAAGTGGLFGRTTDGGTTWTSLISGLPNLTIDDVLLDPDIGGTVYVATDVGVYRSVDGGQSWLPLGTGLPNVIVHSIRLDRPTRTLRAATYGRGMWDLSVPASGQVAITISSNVSGAYFTLEDGSIHQAPVTFYWYTGAKHTVTWSAPAGSGARYIFENWSDSSTANPRTITVPAAGTTYTGNLVAQYLLTVAVSPSLGGSLVVSPTSPDGFYNAGQAVTLTAVPSSGYGFWEFSGDLSGGTSPQTITMNAAHIVTASFFCDFNVLVGLPSEVGPGPVSGMLIWTPGAGCQTSAASNAVWLTLGAQTAANGFTVIPFSIPENSGASQSATVTFTGDYSRIFQITQDAAGVSLPNVVSVSPNSGNASTQVFTVQVYDALGYAALAQVDFDVSGMDNLSCQIALTGAGGRWWLWLLSDAGTFIDPVSLPGTGTIENNECKLSGATSSVSGSGKLATINLGITFKPAFLGSRYFTGQALDSTTNTFGPNVPLGTWTVVGSPPSLSFTKTADSAVVAAGSAIGFTVAEGNSAVPGTTAATAVTLNDPLPSGTGIDWSISPAYAGPGTCAITGAVGSQTLACTLGKLAAGASASVHVTSSTIQLSCNSYSNTATLTSGNTGSLQSTATTTVQCPALSVSGPAALPIPVANLSYPVTAMTASGGTGVYSWTAAGLPTGLTIDPATGTIAGMPTAAAGSQFAVKVTVTDSSGVTASANYTLTVNGPLMISGPLWLPVGTLNLGYPAIQFVAQGGGGYYAWSAKGLPSGLAIDPNSGIIAGTPTTVAGSPFQVVATVEDSYAVVASLSYTLTVGSVSPCDIGSGSDTSAADVRLIMQEALGLASAVHDLNRDGSVGVVDVQVVINAAAGMSCMAR